MFNRKIAFIDLSSRKISIHDIPLEWRQKYIGARGINSFLFFSLVKPPIDPFEERNPLILGAGMLSGLPGFGTGRMTITALSPECGYFGDSNIGGHFGPELRYAGFDHIVITGKSPEPSYLLIKNGHIDIRLASHFWGKNTWETQEILKQENQDERLQVLAIGVAGEKLVRIASIMTGYKSAAGRFGLGAVMGSKNLKAIAARGTKDLTIANPKKMLEYMIEQNNHLLSLKWIKGLRRFGTPVLMDAINERGFILSKNDQEPPLGEKGRAIFAETLDQFSTGKASCAGCAVHCRHRHFIKDGKYAGTRGEGPEFGALLSFGCLNEVLQPDAVVYASDLCNLYGMDLQDAGKIISFAIDIYQKGILPRTEAVRPLEWGNAESVIGLIHDIAQRRGIGDILADGPFCLKRLPDEAAPFLPLVRNNIIMTLGIPFVKTFALARVGATAPGHQHRNMPSLDVIGLPEDILKNLYGKYVSSKYQSYEGKSLMVWWHELDYAICDALGCCRFQTVFQSPHAPKFEEYAELIKLATGWDMNADSLKKIGERIYTTERLILGQFGIGSSKEDVLPDKWYTRKLAGGAGGKEIEVLDREKFKKSLFEYYSLHGWNEEGIPEPKTVSGLGIKELDLKQIGYS